MAGSDSYTTSLGEICDRIEKIYSITDFMEQQNSDIVSIVRMLDSNIVSAEKPDVAAQNREAGKQIVLLSYLCFRLDYYQTLRLDFSVFYAVDEIERILLLFTDRKNFTSKSMRSVNRLIKLLAKTDAASTKIRYGLTYRFLRIFIVLVMYDSSCNSSIVASFLLQQLQLQNGMNVN